MPCSYNKRISGVFMSEIKKIKIFLLTFSILFLFSSREYAQEPEHVKNLVNTSHLDSLYEEININESIMGIIHIYSDYPGYKWISDDDEGAACVDDASRAAVFYLKEYDAGKDTAALLKAERLMDFLLFMQSDNGFFYNFIFDDHTINKTHKNSVSQAGWWSWRAMWALSEGYGVLKNVNPDLAVRIEASLKRSVRAAEQSFPGDQKTGDINGIKIPGWLPDGSASDQAAVLLLAFANVYELMKDSSVIPYMDKLSDGILMMQKGGSEEVPYGAILSWQNEWHAYGSSQSYALLKASRILKRTDIREAAVKEINFFYDYLLKNNYLSGFEIAREGKGFSFSKQDKFSQIAYGIRPMLFASLEAFSLTEDSLYKLKAAKIARWFFGNNPAHAQMYNPSTGICYDGINSESEINLNSGAESTIEALLSMQMLSKYGLTKKDILKSEEE